MEGAEVSGRKHTMKPEFLCFIKKYLLDEGGRWQISN